MKTSNLLEIRLQEIDKLDIDKDKKLISKQQAIETAKEMSNIDKLFEEALTPLEIQLQEIDKLDMLNIEKLDMRQQAIESDRDKKAKEREAYHGDVEDPFKDPFKDVVLDFYHIYL